MLVMNLATTSRKSNAVRFSILIIKLVIQHQYILTQLLYPKELMGFWGFGVLWYSTNEK